MTLYVAGNMELAAHKGRLYAYKNYEFSVCRGTS
jgi:hypothetical protein